MQAHYNEELQALRELQAAIEQSALSVVLDSSGTIVSVNEKYSRLCGFSLDELKGRAFADLVAEDYPIEIFRSGLSCASRGVTWRLELAQKSRLGSVFWIEVTLAPVVDAQGTTKRIHAIGFDVSERKLVERSLASAQNFQRTLMEMAPVGFMLADVHGGCTYINQRWSSTAGVRLRKALGKGWIEVVHPEDRERVQNLWSGIVSSSLPFECEFRYLSPDGRERWVAASAIKVEGRAGQAAQFLRAELDITESKEAQRLLDVHRAQMNSAAKMSALGEMAGGIAHEINNPLAIIQARAEQLRERFELQGANVDVEWLNKTAQTIEATSARIAKIIKSMRTISRDADRDAFEDVPLKPWIEETLEICKARFQQSGVHLRSDTLDPDLRMSCRSVQLSQVLLNLLNNAFDAVKNLEEKWVHVGVCQDSEGLVLSVTDSGFGVPAKIRDKIFQPFFTTKEPGSGTGLGLSVSKSIVEQHGGSLGIDSAANHTRFVVRFPKHESGRTK